MFLIWFRINSQCLKIRYSWIKELYPVSHIQLVIIDWRGYRSVFGNKFELNGKNILCSTWSKTQLKLTWNKKWFLAFYLVNITILLINYSNFSNWILKFFVSFWLNCFRLNSLWEWMVSSSKFFLSIREIQFDQMNLIRLSNIFEIDTHVF